MRPPRNHDSVLQVLWMENILEEEFDQNMQLNEWIQADTRLVRLIVNLRDMVRKRKKEKERRNTKCKRKALSYTGPTLSIEICKNKQKHVLFEKWTNSFF